MPQELVRENACRQTHRAQDAKRCFTEMLVLKMMPALDRVPNEPVPDSIFTSEFKKLPPPENASQVVSSGCSKKQIENEFEKWIAVER